MFNPQSRVPRPKSGRTLKWNHTHAVGRVRDLTLLLPIVLLCFATSFSQIHIHEKVDITKDGVKDHGLMKPGQPPPSIVSGFLIPRTSALRTSLQVQYGSIYRLDWEIPSYASLETYRRGSTFEDSLVPRFPDLPIADYRLFTNFCGPDEWHWDYYYTPSAATEWDTVARVSRGDTIQFAYITQRSGPLYWLRDTLHIVSADTVKVREISGDSVVVGWRYVTFGNYNICLDTWWDKLEVFVGLNCATYETLSQGHPDWGSQHYLYAYTKTAHTLRTISDLGCALTSMAIIGRGFGLNVSPATLNSYMKDTSRFSYHPNDSALVRWEALDSWQGQNQFKYLYPRGDGLDADNPSPVSLGLIDTLLNECRPIIAQVYHMRTHNAHWVVLTGKNSNGRYPIFDPGESNNPFLDNPNDPLKDYHNLVYAIRVYGKKKQ